MANLDKRSRHDYGQPSELYRWVLIDSQMRVCNSKWAVMSGTARTLKSDSKINSKSKELY